MIELHRMISLFEYPPCYDSQPRLRGFHSSQDDHKHGCPSRERSRQNQGEDWQCNMQVSDSARRNSGAVDRSKRETLSVLNHKQDQEDQVRREQNVLSEMHQHWSCMRRLQFSRQSLYRQTYHHPS